MARLATCVATLAFLLSARTTSVCAQSSTTAKDSVRTAPRLPRFSFEAKFGTGENLVTPLVVNQQGYPTIRLNAHYATKPFGPYTPYYEFRIRARIHEQPWELELVHHRLYLTNTTPEIARFDVHFGYNYLLLGRAWPIHGMLLHTAVGATLPNYDNIVRGHLLRWTKSNALDVAYKISGVGAGVTLSREFPLVPHTFLAIEGGVLAAQTTVPVYHGSARVPNVGVHARVGLGVF